MARLRDRLIAHGEIADFLVPSLQPEGLALTLLFAGPSGVGKKQTAMSLAQALLCERSSAGCGFCGSCLRVEQGHHEGLRLIEPDGTQIKIDQARELIEFLQLQRISRSRVVIIDQAHLMNLQAANSLLKVFEEPPPGTFIFLIAPSPSSVLPTLRSRSRTVLFRPLSEVELRQIQAAPDWAVRAARGSVESLRQLLEPESQELRAESCRLLVDFLAQKDFLLSETWRGALKEKGFFSQMLRIWIGLIRDALMEKAGGQKLLMNPDQKQMLSLLNQESLPRLERLWEALSQLEGEMVFHRDTQLALEQMWVRWVGDRESTQPPQEGHQL